MEFQNAPRIKIQPGSLGFSGMEDRNTVELAFFTKSGG